MSAPGSSACRMLIRFPARSATEAGAPPPFAHAEFGAPLGAVVSLERGRLCALAQKEGRRTRPETRHIHRAFPRQDTRTCATGAGILLEDGHALTCEEGAWPG